LDNAPPDPRIIAIGDGIGTDVLGGVQEDLDVLFISGGLAAAETKTVRQPDANALATYLQGEQMSATYTIGHLR
jgi:ribonucleotide monophosphatase NagD (HAD superfamily)